MTDKPMRDTNYQCSDNTPTRLANDARVLAVHGTATKLSVGKLNLEIEIVPRDNCAQLSRLEWDALAENSKFKNPFFMAWNLLPALKHLEPELLVYVVALRSLPSEKGAENAELLALFPVAIHKARFGLSTLRIWKHDHSYLVDPLIKKEIALKEIFLTLCRHFSVPWCELHLHSPNLFAKGDPVDHASFKKRAAILSTESASLPHLSGRQRREHKRICARATRDLGAELVQHLDTEEGLRRFVDLEMQGWKREAGGAIACNEATLLYYQECFAAAGVGTIEFYELWVHGKDHCIASNMRIVRQGHLFDIKTCFDEAYKAYYPGKVLELMCLEQLATKKFEQVDSCTDQNNDFINKIWRDRITLQTSHIFANSIGGKVLKVAHKIKQHLQKNFK